MDNSINNHPAVVELNSLAGAFVPLASDDTIVAYLRNVESRGGRLGLMLGPLSASSVPMVHYTTALNDAVSKCDFCYVSQFAFPGICDSFDVFNGTLVSREWRMVCVASGRGKSLSVSTRNVMCHTCGFFDQDVYNEIREVSGFIGSRIFQSRLLEEQGLSECVPRPCTLLIKATANLVRSLTEDYQCIQEEVRTQGTFVSY